MTTEEFDKRLEAKLDNCTGADLLTIPGMYEVVSEWFNNDILDDARLEQEIETQRGGDQ